MSDPQINETELDNLTQLLEHTDVPCPKCNYNLRTNTTGLCAECGSPFTFQSLINSPREKLLPYLLTLITLATILPQSLILWQRLAIRHAVHYGIQWYNGQWQLPPFTIFQSLTMIASHLFWFGMPLWVTCLLIFRRRFIALPKPIQWVIAATAFVLVFLAYRRYQFWYYSFNFHNGQWPPNDLWYLTP
ncbi:hypothetical protein [Poriferisphaera corsica]|uniref:hypothetical protein n=1 Tax=Poriferisphaera corsica TaxID=2528020 RepID=UPI0011A3CBA2|nr:hypothetical protein [Poriferisphaera corsica]